MADDLDRLTQRATDAEARLTTLEAARQAPGGANFSVWADFSDRVYWGMTEADLVMVRANASSSDALFATPWSVATNTYAANALRWSPAGLLIEPGIPANLFVTPGTPATQTITLSTGTYVLWITGQSSATVGTIEISAGTGIATAIETSDLGVATVPSLNLGKATSNRWVKLTVTTGGTFVFTKTNTVSFASLTAGIVPQAGIQANSVTKPLDKLSIADAVIAAKLNPTAITVFMEGIPFTQNPATAGTENLFAISDGTNSNRFGVGRSAGSNTIAARVQRAGPTVGSANALQAFRVGQVGVNRWAMAASVAGGLGICANGLPVQTGAVSAMPLSLTKCYIGADGAGTSTFNGIITKFGISTVRESDATLRAWTRVA